MTKTCTCACAEAAPDEQELMGRLEEVLADGKLAGLISIGDVVKFMLDAQQATIQSLEKYITGTF